MGGVITPDARRSLYLKSLSLLSFLLLFHRRALPFLAPSSILRALPRRLFDSSEELRYSIGYEGVCVRASPFCAGQVVFIPEVAG